MLRGDQFSSSTYPLLGKPEVTNRGRQLQKNWLLGSHVRCKLDGHIQKVELFAGQTLKSV